MRYRSIYIIYKDGRIESFFAQAGAVMIYWLSEGDTEINICSPDNGDAWQPRIDRYLKPGDRLEINTHKVRV